jgi:DNA (cytosine-5)-methyltransferase 1
MQSDLLERLLDEEGLDAKLTALGMSLDNLEYDMKAPDVRGNYLRLEDIAVPGNGIPVVSFFAGCGGMDLGFEAAGFAHRAAVEIHPNFANTLRQNRPDWNVIGPPNCAGDVSDVYTLASQLRASGVDYKFPGVFIGGPPCQPFSIAANQRFSKSGDNFKRTGFEHANGSLLFKYLDLIEVFSPSAFVVENVSGLIDVDGGEQISNAIERMRLLGYAVTAPMILNASEYLVPQHRYRLFLIGHRTKSQFVAPGKANETLVVGPALRLGTKKLLNHQAREHKPESLVRYMRLKIGERDQLGRVDRLDPRRPSKTIIAGGTKGGGRSHLHPYIPRTLTVRECARLQTFPDEYLFTGPMARQFTQVGNAVPPVLAAQIAKSVAKLF